MDITAQDFLLTMLNPEDTLCLRMFDDKKNGVFSGTKLEIKAGKFHSIEETLLRHSALNRGVFYVVNYGGHDDKNILESMHNLLRWTTSHLKSSKKQ